MNLKIRRIQFDVQTSRGPTGADLEFPDGLVVIRAENTSGKSSILQGILYGLGLEGMLGPSRDVPFPHALTDRVEIAGEERAVLESHVRLEAEGADSEVVTIERTIKGEERSELLRTWPKSIEQLKQDSSGRRDYYVRRAGAAINERGFHHFLEQFIGFALPVVPKHTGEQSKLYLEAVFPLLYVEQKQGWSVIEGRFPTYLGIRQMAARAIEFILDLEAFDASAARVALTAEEAALRQRWASKREAVEVLAARLNGVVDNLASSPTSTWPPEVSPQILLPTAEGFKPLHEEVLRLEALVERLLGADVPTVEEALVPAREELRLAQQSHARFENASDEILEELEFERAQRAATEQKLELIDADLKKYKDLLRLIELGSTEAQSISIETCPTCHQGVSDALLPPGTDIEPMGLDDNVRFLEEQKRTFSFILEGTDRALIARERHATQLLTQLEESRDRIRSLKRTLTTDERLPSDAVIRERVVAEERLAALRRLEEDFAEYLNGFAGLSDDWMKLQEQKASLPSGDLTDRDRQKLAEFRQIFLDQLQAYGFRSLDPNSIEISLDNYRPVHEGIDLQFDLSASDTIRTIWAYRLGLLELSNRTETNHPGCLMFDEPGQQEIAPDAFRTLLRRAALVAGQERQIIIATSEQSEVVTSSLEGRSHHYIELEGFLIR